MKSMTPTSVSRNQPRFICQSLTCALLSIVAACEAPHQGDLEKSGLGQTRAQANAVIVTPAIVQKKLFVRSVELPGRVVPIESTPLHAKVTGYVQSIAVDIGDKIKGPHGDQQGDVLCELLVPELREELAEKAALIKQAQALIAQSEAGVTVAEAVKASAEARWKESQANVAKTDSLMAKWNSEYERLDKLAQEGVVTKKVAEEAKSEMEAAKAGRDEATAKIASAKALLQEAEAGVVKARADFAATQSKMAVAEAEQRRLESLVEYSKIRAPYDGVVVERNVHTGHLVQASGGSGQLFSVMRIDPIRLAFDVPESEAVHVAKANRVRFRPPGATGDPIETTIARTSWSLNNASRTLLAEVELANPDSKWRPGAYLSVQLVVAEIPDAICIPKTAAFTQEKQTFCYVIGESGALRKQSIVLGLASMDEWQVRDGLLGGEQIIGRNVGAFREGQRVAIAAASSGSNAGAR
jgi:HlyD family secretion protein